jgi:mannitol-1-phosphate 5-dehydrogenase
MTETNGPVIIGAGKTGRGFIGRLLQESGLGFHLVDRDRDLIRNLRDSGHFEVGFFDGSREPVRVTDYVAMNPDDPQLGGILRETRLVFISVGGTRVAEVAKWLASQWTGRIDKASGECSVILCENAVRPAELFRQSFMSSLKEDERSAAGMMFGFSEATVFCTTIESSRNPLDIRSEDYSLLQCSSEPLKSNLPAVRGLVPIRDFDDFLTRKLYTYNAASAAISYLGSLKGYTVFSDAANDPDVLLLLEKLYLEVGKAICAEFGYGPEEQREFAARSLAKFRDRAIRDTIARNAREPHRKLASGERIIGAALLVEKHSGDVGPLAVTAAAALLFRDGEDAEWSALQKASCPAGILEKVSGLRQSSTLALRILDEYAALKKKFRCR